MSLLRRFPRPNAVCFGAIVVTCATSARASAADTLDDQIGAACRAAYQLDHETALQTAPATIRRWRRLPGAHAVWCHRRGLARRELRQRDAAASELRLALQSLPELGNRGRISPSPGNVAGRAVILSRTFTALRALPASRAVIRHNAAPALV